MSFHIATTEEIREGKTSDIYFSRTVEILRKNKIRKKVKAELLTHSMPYPWGVFMGWEEIAHLLKDVSIKVSGLPEGTFFRAGETVLTLEGYYSDFGIYETAILGFMCQASGIATKAARLRKLAKDKTILSFGARRMHPALSPMIERNAYVGGCDGVSVIKSAELLGIPPSGTMPHALILMVGDEEKAFKLFDKTMPSDVQRIALIDTFSDEKFGALKAVHALKKRLFGVRLDTPSSRKGDMIKILQEVRWELDLHGYRNVKIFLSGGLDEKDVSLLAEYVDGFGIGTSISNAPVINFSMDIIEINGKPLAKRGKWAGEKKVFRCPQCYDSRLLAVKTKEITDASVTGAPVKCSNCSKAMVALTQPLPLKPIRTAQKIRKEVLKQLPHYDL